MTCLTAWIDLEGYYTEWNVRWKRTKTMWFHSYVEYKIEVTDELTKQKQTHRYTQQNCGYQRRKGMGEGWSGWNIWKETRLWMVSTQQSTNVKL